MAKRNTTKIRQACVGTAEPIQGDAHSAGAPPLEGATLDAIVRLLAHLLTSACRQDVSGEGRDETR